MTASRVDRIDVCSEAETDGNMCEARKTSGHSKTLSLAVSRLQGFGRLVIGCVCIIAAWGYLLPLLATTNLIEQRLEFLEDREIDPSAMFYTELSIMDRILDKNAIR